MAEVVEACRLQDHSEAGSRTAERERILNLGEVSCLKTGELLSAVLSHWLLGLSKLSHCAWWRWWQLGGGSAACRTPASRAARAPR
jgi:hypothetical protein